MKIRSSLRLKSKTPLEKDEVHKINTILMHLNNHSESIDFREPVDWKGLVLFMRRTGAVRLPRCDQVPHGPGHHQQETAGEEVQDCLGRAQRRAAHLGQLQDVQH